MSGVIVAVDPGTTRSAYCVLNGLRIVAHGIEENDAMLEAIRSNPWQAERLVVEMVQSFGMAVGHEVFETCVWIGRFIQAAPVPFSAVFRRAVKLHMCGSPRANDATIRQALLDRFGAPGTKKSPGATYGIRADVWQALALGVTWQEKGREVEA